MNKTAERALLARPLALGLGVLGIVWLNPVLRQDGMFPWLAAIFGGPSLLLWVGRDLRPIRRIAGIASPAIALLGWGTLATFTLGLKSPILAAFFFEIGLAAISVGPLGVLGVTGGSIALLVVVQSLFGLAAGWPLLLMEAAFLAVMGGLGLAMARRRVAGEAALRTQSDELGRRLETLQRQLDDERVVARVGENVARLAHGLKNAVHSLRGFVGLIEPAVERGGSSREALAGLRTVIDDLERLARLTLAEAPPARAEHALASASGPDPKAAKGRNAAADANAARRVDGETTARRARLVPVIDAAARDLGPSNPEVVFELRVAPEARMLWVPIAATPLHELLTILLRNAAEAMRGTGRCTLDVVRRGERGRVEIADEGDGLAPDAQTRLFTPGFTTKAGGSGFGLFLARRIVEDHGGSLALVSRPEKGAIAVLELPLASGPDEPQGETDGVGPPPSAATGEDA
ncbi:MAG: HAMP domain-containing histidine kinase [Deltaproteobacteria bacterium]|nr:HAMP domain-containing histidine kinase [Deltaproteobacteria bacterium]